MFHKSSELPRRAIRPSAITIGASMATRVSLATVAVSPARVPFWKPAPITCATSWIEAPAHRPKACWSRPKTGAADRGAGGDELRELPVDADQPSKRDGEQEGGAERGRDDANAAEADARHLAERELEAEQHDGEAPAAGSRACPRWSTTSLAPLAKTRRTPPTPVLCRLAPIGKHSCRPSSSDGRGRTPPAIRSCFALPRGFTSTTTASNSSPALPAPSRRCPGSSRPSSRWWR